MSIAIEIVDFPSQQQSKKTFENYLQKKHINGEIDKEVFETSKI
jgi:hypothetical protein